MRSALAYRDQLQALLPPGPAWPRDEQAELTQLLQALADEFARVDRRSLDLVEEMIPLTALELLGDWERAVGLPDPCSPVSDGVRERQLAIARKLAGVGGQSRPFFIELARAIGIEVEIEEYAPFGAGSRAGQLLYDDAWRHAFAVVALSDSLLFGDESRVQAADFRAGESHVGDRLRSFGAEDLECVIRRARPAHSHAQIAYLVDPEPELWFDFTRPLGD